MFYNYYMTRRSDEKSGIKLQIYPGQNLDKIWDKNSDLFLFPPDLSHILLQINLVINPGVDLYFISVILHWYLLNLNITLVIAYIYSFIIKRFIKIKCKIKFKNYKFHIYNYNFY
jgi:hypothetical protein